MRRESISSETPAAKLPLLGRGPAAKLPLLGSGPPAKLEIAKLPLLCSGVAGVSQSRFWFAKTTFKKNQIVRQALQSLSDEGKGRGQHHNFIDDDRVFLHYKRVVIVTCPTWRFTCPGTSAILTVEPWCVCVCLHVRLQSLCPVKQSQVSAWASIHIYSTFLFLTKK